MVDNTFATPLLQRPLEHGADLVVHSVTKLLSGHSDVLLGAVVAPSDDPETFAALAGVRQLLGAIPGPMEAYLCCADCGRCPSGWAGRSRTPRCWPSGWPSTRRSGGCAIPGCRTIPAYSGRGRTMSGFGSLISVELADADDGGRLGRRAAGCGCSPPASAGWSRPWNVAGGGPLSCRRVPEGLVRLSVGIEHVEDLWADLAQALDGLDASALSSARAWPSGTSAR